MIKIGQIVEIPASSSIFIDEVVVYDSKQQELSLASKQRNYGLFDGFLVGEHPGIEHYKLGQRKGINVGGKKEPLYVIGINHETNQLFVGQGENHPGLWINIIKINHNQLNTNAISSGNHDLEHGIQVQIDSVLTDNDSATLFQFGDAIFLEFEKPVPISIQDQHFELDLGHQNQATIRIN